MSIALRNGIIYLEDQCRVEDAEPLLNLLQAKSGAAVDLTNAGHLHAAVVQILLAFRPVIIGPAGAAFVRRYIEPLLTPNDQGRVSP